MEVIGYKCFNKDLTNRYGMKFEVGKTYVDNGIIRFGDKGHGFHMCERLEDTLRYFDAMDGQVSICLVKGSGTIVEEYDDFNGYYNMYSTSVLEIIKELSRDEIIDMAILFNEIRVERFLSCFRLNDYEISLFKDKFANNYSVISYIGYYQENDYNAFKKKVKLK